MKRRFLAPGLLASVAVLGLSGPLFGAADPAPQKQEQQPAATTSQGTSPTPATEWKVDAEGHKYRVLLIPKVEGGYMILGPYKVRLAGGINVDIEKQDEKFFYVKEYAPEPPPPPPPPVKVDPVIEQSYAIETSETSLWNVTPVDSGLPTQQQWRNGFAIGDVNGDGFVDIVSGPPRRNLAHRPVIFAGDGTGHFTALKDMKWPEAKYEYGDAAIGDFNGDSRKDLAFASHLGDIFVLLGGDGGYRLETLPKPGVDQKAGFSSRTLAVVDWNGDGRDDLVAYSEGPTRQGSQASPYIGGKVIYSLGKDGKWAVRTTEFKDDAFGDVLAVADVNGDGKPDLVSSSSRAGDKAVLSLNNGKGLWVVGNVPELRGGGFVWSVAAADLNEDKRTDLVVGYQSNQNGKWRSGVDVFYGAAKGWKRRTLWNEESRTGVFAVTTGDLDGDGKIDIAAADGDGKLMLFPATGSFFGREKPFETGGCRAWRLKVADLDKDGSNELIGSFAGERCKSQGSIQVWRITKK